VTEILAFDAKANEIYYISTNRDPRKRHLFKVGTIENAKRKQSPECLTCEFADDCQYVSAVFSKSAKYYILNCLGPGVPYFILKSTVDERHLVLEDNAELKARITSKAMPSKEYYEIDLGGNNRAWAEVYLPPTLKKSHIIQYPLLVHTYGGPGTQRVTEQFNIGWGTYLSSSENIIYASIDGRGSGARGMRYLHSVYGNLGTIEVEDQITGARFLQNELFYVDDERMAIWGWSYGGFVTAHAVGDPSHSVKCGIAVAPVTDWRYYDTVYTERYMGLARENYQGYDQANVSRKAENFRGKHFLLIHGTADDNVHFQHSAQFMKSLVENDVDFRSQIYSDKNHGISGSVTSKHLYRTMTHFLKQDCWDGGEPRPGPEDVEIPKETTSKK